MVAENPEGEIVGTWEAIAPVVLEGLWVREDYRKTMVLGKIFISMKSLLRSMNISRAFTLVQTPDVKALAEKGGFEMIPGEFCMLDLDKVS
jgi:N-acetylglutamate synthase-like GNAT family acetyltransferase